MNAKESESDGIGKTQSEKLRYRPLFTLRNKAIYPLDSGSGDGGDQGKGKGKGKGNMNRTGGEDECVCIHSTAMVHSCFDDSHVAMSQAVLWPKPAPPRVPVPSGAGAGASSGRATDSPVG